MFFLLLSTLLSFFTPVVYADINSTSAQPQTVSAEQSSLSQKTTLEMSPRSTAFEQLQSSTEKAAVPPQTQPSQLPSGQQSEQTADQLKQLKLLRSELSEVKKQLQATAGNDWQFRKSLSFSDKEISINNTMLAMLTALLSLIIALFAVFLTRRAKNKAVYEATKNTESLFLTWLEEKESEIVSALVGKTTVINNDYGKNYLTSLDERLFTAQKTAKDLAHLSDLYLSIKTQYENDIRASLSQFDQTSAADDIKKFTINVNNRLTHKAETDYSAADNFDKAILLFHQNGYPDTIKFLDKVINSPQSSDLLITKALFNKAYTLQKCEQITAALNIYDQVILRVAEDAPIELQQQVINSLFQKGCLLKQLNQFDLEIAVYEEIVSRFSGVNELFFEVRVSTAVMNKAQALAEKGAGSNVLSIYTTLIEKLKSRSEVQIQQIVAQALVHKSNYLAMLGQQQESISCYESVISLFAQSKNLQLQILVAQSFSSLLDIYHIQEKPLALIELCDKIQLRFSGHKTLRFNKLVARSLAAKANILLKFNKIKEALKLFDEIMARYKEIKDPELQTAVNNAMTNAALISLLCEEITDTRQRIREAEKANHETSFNFVVMGFMHFLTDDLSIEKLLDKTGKLAENATFDFSFAPLKGLIKRLPATKKRQADAAIDFFENHHDLDKFIKQASH
ncbi:hypothetical protein [Psychromonas sp.]|uniref:hypothetical protein n=1 Tax=Psychromonas sp. TaxID=1884585 RepID=UPI003565E4CA